MREETFPTPNDRSAEATRPSTEGDGSDSEKETFKRWCQGTPYKDRLEEEAISQEDLISPGNAGGGHEDQNGGFRLRMLDRYLYVENEQGARCEICGSLGHAKLRGSTTEGTEDSDLFRCPVAWQDEWRALPGPQVPMQYQQYEVSRYKLAESIDYDVNRVAQVMENYSVYGEGQFKTAGVLCLMENSLRHICEAYHTTNESRATVNPLPG